MDERPPEQRRQPKKWAGKKTTIAFWVLLSVLFVLFVLLFWVVFDSQDDCSSHRICCLLGINDKTEAIKLLGLAMAGIGAFFGGGGG